MGIGWKVEGLICWWCEYVGERGKNEESLRNVVMVGVSYCGGGYLDECWIIGR